MSLLPLRFLFFPLLTIASSLHAFDWSDPLPKRKTSEFWDLSGNGLVTYVEENRTIASCGSIRVVLKNNPFPSEIFAFELTPSNWHELSSFFDACKQRLNSSEHSLAIVAVGDFVESHIRALCQEPFASFVFTSSVSQKEPFLLIPAPISDVVVALNYCNSLQPISSLGDLYQRWIDIVLENVVQKRLSKIAQAQGLNLTYDHSDSFYPMDSCFIHITASNKSYLKVLFTLLEELEQIKQEGFSEGEIMRSRAPRFSRSGRRDSRAWTSFSDGADPGTAS